MFSTLVEPNLGLLFSGIPDGIQECATYNPPGPTKPGNFQKVVSSYIFHSSFNVLILPVNNCFVHPEYKLVDPMGS